MRDAREEAAKWKAAAEDAGGKVQRLGLELGSERERHVEAARARDVAKADVA